MNFRNVLLLLLIMISPVVGAQESGDSWDWKVAPYLWMTSFHGSTSIGPIEADIDFDFGDVLEDLQFAAEVFIAADRGHHGFHFDATYLELEDDPQPAPIGPGEITTDIDMTLAEVAYRYHVSGSVMGHTLLLGARYIDTKITLTPTLVPTIEASVDWIDGFVGYQYVASLADHWDSQFQVTAGTGGSDLTVTAQLLFFRETKGGNHWVFGARIWDIDYDDTVGVGIPFELDLTNSGLLAGFVFD